MLGRQDSGGPRQALLLVRDDDKVGKLRLCLAAVLQSVKRGGDDANAAGGEVLVMRFELT